MKRTSIFIFLLASMMLLTSCSTIKGIFGKSSSAEEKAAAKIEQVEDKQDLNQTAALKQISSLSYGVGFSLEKITNKEPEVFIAQDLNGRILTLSGQPSLEDIKSMQSTIENLRTNVDVGRKMLAVRDKVIEKIQKEKEDLINEREKEIQNYQDIAQQTARRADSTQSKLDQYRGWFGLKAVFMGLKQFFFSSMWILLGLLVVFLVLRGFAASNPIVGAIFGVFEQIVSFVISGIKTLFPKAVALAGHVPKVEFDAYKQTLTHIIDCIELLKQKNPNATLNDILTECDKTMDSDDKERVDIIKKSLHWT